MTDASDFIPKYYQISLDIIKEIKGGKLPPGSRIMSENEIISQYHVSNTTARKVLIEIENAGLVEKVRGKGTFVKDFVADRVASKILGFTRNMTDQGLTPSTQVIDTEVLKHNVPISTLGKTYIIQAPVFKLRRLRLANSIPMMHETRYISMLLCPGIAEQDLEGSLYKIYKEVYHQNIIEVKQNLSAVILDEFSRKVFLLEKAIPGMKVAGVTFCGKELILEGEESLYRGDKYKFGISATP